MNLTEMTTNLVTDLKMTLAAEISQTECTRAITKAVDELSRHIPREMIYDHTWVKAVVDDSFTTPAVASDITIVNAMDISASVSGNDATIASSWFDVPRPAKMTLLDANNSITHLTLIIKGVDVNGIYQEERLYRHGGKVQTGKIYFYAIYEVEMNYIVGNGAADKLSVGSDSPSLATGGVWVQLDNPIEPGTEVVYSGLLKTGTKYTKDTDYEMDYANGRIRMKYGTTMAVSTTYYVSYNRASTSINISSILPELLRVVKVLYPADKVPEQQAAFSIWENILTIGSLRQGSSQSTLVDKDHVAIYYEGKQAPPSTTGPGSYPELLDEVVLVGAVGHALLMEALQYEHAAVTDLATSRVELAKVTTLATPVTGKIDLALIKVSLYLETAGTTDNAVDVLGNVTDDAVGLRTAILTAGAAMAGELGKVNTIDLDAATVGSVAWLLEGELLINKLNDGGPDVANKFADYARAKIQTAQTRIQQAMAYAQEMQMRLNDIQSYMAESAGWIAIGQTFIGEAQTLVAEVNALLQEAGKYHEAAGINLVLADRYRAEAQSRLTEFRNTLASKSEYRKKVVSVSVRQPG